MSEELKIAATILALLVSSVSLATVLYRTGVFTGTWTRRADEQNERISALDKRHSTLAEESRTSLVRVRDVQGELVTKVAVLEVQVRVLTETINELKATKASEENLSGVRTALTELKATIERGGPRAHR